MCAVHDRNFNCNYCPIIANDISKHNVVIRSISHWLPFPGSRQNIPMSAMITTTTTNDEDTNSWYPHQACRQRGFEGIRANPPFDPQKILCIPLNCTF